LTAPAAPHPRRFERHHEPLLDRSLFLRRVARHFALAAAVIAVSLALGMAGYHEIAGLPWIDSMLNACMILTGMGPVDAMHTDAAKLFASGYALFCGLMVLTVSGIILAPPLHRMLHRFHLSSDN